jgi:uracil phosphoribosyltransferase
MELWVGSVDERLNDRSFIIPGLGDAGDLSFGEKR